MFFTSDDMIDRCLRLPAVATVGPPNHDVPSIHIGIRIYAYYQECIIHANIMLCHYYALDTGHIVIKNCANCLERHPLSNLYQMASFLYGFRGVPLIY